MAFLSRVLALATVVAHAAVAVAPCAGIADVAQSGASHQEAPSDPHGATGHSQNAAADAHHDVAVDAHHAVATAAEEECGGHERRAPTQATASCPCGCDDGSAPGPPGSRIGFALWVVAPAPLVATPLRDFVAPAPRMPGAPPDRRDPVPI